MSRLENKVKGALYAFAIGDAMGATTEFMNRDQIRKTYGSVNDIIGGGWLHLKRGQVTDDTQMMICVYEGMRGRPTDKADPGYYDTLDNICRKFREWADSNPPDIGNTCRAAIYSSPNTNYFSWIEANEYRQQTHGVYDYGNGGVMRCLVPALMGNRVLTLDQAYITHTNEFTQQYTDMYRYYLKKALFTEKPLVERKLREPSGYVKNTVYNAVEWFRCSNDLPTAIISAVNDGGDADTIAALTGGLAGAYYGYTSIPERWIKHLDPEVCTKLDEITQYILENMAE